MKMNEKFANFLPKDLQFKSENQKEDIATRVKMFYFDDEPVGENNILSLTILPTFCLHIRC